MTVETNEKDLAERVKLIESMMTEGRQTTEGWGWTFVLWGVAFYAAMAWSAWGPKATLAWPVTMIAAFVLTGVIASRRARSRPRTTMGRALGAVWMATGISMFVLLIALAGEGLLETQAFMGILAAMLGVANAASSFILKWKVQFGCTVIWWATCWICVVGTDTQGTVTLLITVFLCQILFGVYCMISEARARRSEEIHA